ncbi:hypothetical protein DFR29_103294 [Tahibacter aquaticus]|uniref:Uncharacterized protein n=1 Tax=Tahibacter aquaticus TaxID=520092 RepID=A0A4R6Z4Y4_9GAMM|nr:hypothetical protein [Tahibacter aquaticus]TDR46758.1 hypothetical protein DFR29_103294 [Tahibacter aquaticus]
MVITCPKCRHENVAATGQAMEACPQCGVIYARAALAQHQQRQVESVRARVAAAVPDGNAPGFVERFGWYLTIAGALYGSVMLISTWVLAESAPQQAAGAGLAAAAVVVPYCLARALQQLFRK